MFSKPKQTKAKMPLRKEPKEAVVYAASKRKPPPFKPQRPSKVARTDTAESERSRPNITKKSAAPARRKSSALPDADSEESENEQGRKAVGVDDSDEELDDDPLASKPRKQSKSIVPPPPRRRHSRQPSPMSISSQQSSDAAPDRPAAAPGRPPAPSQSEGVPTIPQPLLIRLLHEHFADKQTKIDKHAMQVLQKYVEVFLRETIARTAMQKKVDAAKAGGTEEVDVSWLELEDLEKVAAGVVLEF